MDKDTFDRIRDLRGQAQKAANDHEAPADHGSGTPGQRFRALGQFVMDNDRFPKTNEFGDKTYKTFANFPDGVTVRLIAETMRAGKVRAPIHDLFRVQAEWAAGSVDHPMHVDSVANITDSGTPYEHDLKALALVEESFTAAMPHVSRN